MKQTFVGILVSSDVEMLKESLLSVKEQKDYYDFDIFVIINTSNENNFVLLSEYLKNVKDVRTIRTLSNGRPGKGHNSVLEEFKKSNYERLVMLDGDDMLYPYALKRIDLMYNLTGSSVLSLVGNSFLRRNKQGEKFIEELYINDISSDFNKILATPSRIVSLTKEAFDILETTRLYHEQMYIYDDYLAFLLNYRKQKEDKVVFFSDSNIYLYNQLSVNSVSKNEDVRKLKNDTDIKKQLMKKYKIKTLKCEEINIKRFSKTIPDQNVENWKRNICNKRNKKLIFMIDSGSDYIYSSQFNKALGGTEQAFINVANILSAEMDVKVFTNTKVEEQVSQSLCFLPKEQFQTILLKESPNFVIAQGWCWLKFDCPMFLYIQHDVNVHFIKENFKKKEEVSKFSGYIFVSNWQKNRYISEYNLNFSKCHVIQNGISSLININAEFKKEPTIVYVSSPYRGLLPALYLYKELKKHPDAPKNLKFKVFSSSRCESNESNKPLKQIVATNEQDQYYSSLYQLLIDEGIEYYGSIKPENLFRHIENSMLLFYPNTFAETCCTAVLESMAMKCNVITTNLGALQETCNGFAKLICSSGIKSETLNDTNLDVNNVFLNPTKYDDLTLKYKTDFVEASLKLLNEYNSEKNLDLLNNQKAYIQQKCTWNSKLQLFLNILK